MFVMDVYAIFGKKIKLTSPCLHISSYFIIGIFLLQIGIFSPKNRIILFIVSFSPPTFVA